MVLVNGRARISIDGLLHLLIYLSQIRRLGSHAQSGVTNIEIENLGV